MKLLFVLEGTNLSLNLYVNEATLLNMETRNFRQYFVDPPAGLRLTKAERTTEWYTRTKLGGRGLQPWTLPGMGQVEFMRTVKTFQRDTIFCAGNITVDWLRSLLGVDADIRNIGDMGFIFPKSLSDANCGEYHSNARRCSFAKMLRARDFLDCHPELWK